MKIRSLSIQASLLQKIMLLLCVSLVLIPVLSAAAATQRVYQYNENGRLTVMYTATQKTTYAYDKNGNLISKQVEQGDYNSVVNPTAPTTTQPTTPTPEPTPTPTPTPAPEPAPDPTLVPPPVPTPTKDGLPINYVVDGIKQSSIPSANGGITGSGWYLDPVGIQRIEIYVDYVYQGRAVMGVSREDVYKVYPDYNNHVAGFYIPDLAITTEGTPRKKENRKGKKEVVPGQFNHFIQLKFINRANTVTQTYSYLTMVLDTSKS